MTASGKYEDDEIEREQDTWPRKLPKDETSSREAQHEGGELMDPKLMQSLRWLLPHTEKNSKPSVADVDKEAFGEYGRWLLQKAKFRREQFKRRTSSLDTAVQYLALFIAVQRHPRNLRLKEHTHRKPQLSRFLAVPPLFPSPI
jgi:hypothetical protein